MTAVLSTGVACMNVRQPGRLSLPGAPGFGRLLASLLLAAGKRTVVLASRCDLVTKALASLLRGFIDVPSRLTKASGKMADIIVEGSRVFFTDGDRIYVCVRHVEGNFYFQDENGRQMCVLPIILYKYHHRQWLQYGTFVCCCYSNTSSQSGQQHSVAFPQIWLNSCCSLAAGNRLPETVRPGLACCIQLASYHGKQISCQ